MNNPRVVSFATHDAQEQLVRFTVATDIIDYVEAAQAFGRDSLAEEGARGQFQRRVIAIPDRAGSVVTPMVLTVSSNQGLYLVRKSRGANVSGWQLINLGEDLKQLFGGVLQVRAISANWSDDDRITIAVAVDDGSLDAPSRVLVAYDLSSRTTDWSKLPWIDCGTREKVRVEGIRVLGEDDGSWTVVLAGNRGPDDTIYLLRSARMSSFAGALIFNPAVTMQTISDFETVVHPTFGGGLAVLGCSGGSHVLAVRPFPTYNAEGQIASIAPVVVLPCPAGANVLEAGVTRNGGTDLYLGGQGLHLISADEMVNAEDAKVTIVASAGAASNVQDIVIADAPDGSAVTWALLENGDLEIVRRPVGGSWGAPLCLRRGVQEMAPVHGDAHLGASLLVIYCDGRAATIWQDRGLGIWQEHPLLVEKPDCVTRVTCYGTSLRVLDDSGIPRPGLNVKVSASAVSSVLLNNNAVFIGPGVSFKTQTDANGSVSLFDKVRSLTPAVYRFEVEGVADALDIDPAGGIHERLRTLTAADLRSATVMTPVGAEPLLPESYRNGANSRHVEIVARSLNKLSQLAAAAKCEAPGVRQVQISAPFSSTLSAQDLPIGFRWGLQADQHGVRAAEGVLVDSLVNAAESVGEFFVNLGESIADFFEGIERRIKEGWTFVLHKAEEAFEFICALGNKVKRFVLNTVEQIGGFFTWIWEQIETGIEKVWEWLKFVFNWDDILIVRDAIVDSIDEAMRYAQRLVGPMKETVAKGFDLTLNQIHKWRTEAGGKPAPPRVALGQSLLDDVTKVAQPISHLIDQASGNSVVAWVTNQLGSLMDELIRFEGPNPAKELLDAGADYVERVLADEIGDIINCVDRLTNDLKQIFQGKVPSLKELSFESIKNALIIVGADALEGLICAVRDLVLRSLDLLAKLIGVARDAMFVRMRFPFIEHLVKLVTADAVSVDTSFRLIDGLMLLAAVPATITYKIVKGEAPLRRGQRIDFLFGRVTVQSDSSAELRRASRVFSLVLTTLQIGTATWDQVKAGTEDAHPVASRWVKSMIAGLGMIKEFLDVVLPINVGITFVRTGARVAATVNYQRASANKAAAQSEGNAEIFEQQNKLMQQTDEIMASLDLALVSTHLIVCGANFHPESSDVEGRLGFAQKCCDHVGSLAFAAATLAERNPYLIGAGFVFLGGALVTNVTRIAIA
jgi:hypothetical protein